MTTVNEMTDCHRLHMAYGFVRRSIQSCSDDKKTRKVSRSCEENYYFLKKKQFC